MNKDVIDLVIKINESQGEVNKGFIEAIAALSAFDNKQTEVNADLMRVIEILGERVSLLEKIVFEKNKTES